jgi:ABC-type nitrate/sulfonate/bicarbonate transport system substrate-binding protein
MNSIMFVLLLVGMMLGAMPSTVKAQKAGAGSGKVIIGLPTTSMSMLPIFLAQDKGLFKDEGIEPQLVYVGGPIAGSGPGRRGG